MHRPGEFLLACRHNVMPGTFVPWYDKRQERIPSRSALFRNSALFDEGTTLDRISLITLSHQGRGNVYMAAREEG